MGMRTMPTMVLFSISQQVHLSAASGAEQRRWVDPGGRPGCRCIDPRLSSLDGLCADENRAD
eukprot:SAG31_NODE_8576_length_1428_cov_0.994733_1_plen_61_part_10